MELNWKIALFGIDKFDVKLELTVWNQVELELTKWN